MADPRLTIVVNLTNGSVSQYQNYDFNSIALRGAATPQLYGANSDGLFLLDNGDLDSGSTPISAWLKTMKTPMSDLYQTNFLRGYLNYRATGDLEVTCRPDGWSTGDITIPDRISNYQPDGAWHTDYIDLDTGAWGNQWQFKIANADGCDMSVKNLALISAARKNAPVFSAIKGMNNRLDPALVTYSQRSGVMEMAEIVNMFVDNSLHAHRRKGYTQLAAGKCHSLWSGPPQQEVYMAADGAASTDIFRVMPDGAVQGLRNGLTLGARVWWTWYKNSVYYSNGYENGYIVPGGPSYPWVLTPPQANEVTIQKAFFAPPPGTMMTVFNGRIYMAQGDTVWMSDWGSPGRWRLATEHLRFEGDITMLESVGDRMYIADSVRTYSAIHTFHMGLMRVGSGDVLKLTRVCEFPAIPGTAMVTTGSRVMSARGGAMQGLAVVWTGTEGICAADTAGEFHNITEHKLTYPVSSIGAGCVLARHGQTPGMPVLYVLTLAG